jgi:hypothetical protein
VELWRLEDKIKEAGAHWFPFWEADRHVRVTPRRDTATSGFLLQSQRALLHVVNVAAEPRTIRIELLDSTGLRGRGVDVGASRTGADTRIESARSPIAIRLGANSYARLSIEPE